jgi:DNA-binding winged helix-turn-helix (wHTH) protein
LATVSKDHDRVRFGVFEFDCRSGELRSHGQLLRLEPQPAKVLTVLIRNAGEVVTRQDLIREVWGTEIFVDFEQGLNYAIRRIRIALEDDAEHPQFLETLPKKGHRFTAQIDRDEEVDRNPVTQVPEPKVHPDRRVKLRAVVFYCLGRPYLCLGIPHVDRRTTCVKIPAGQMITPVRKSTFASGSGP